MSDVLSMQEVAETVGYSYRHFRRAWPRLRDEADFPAPFAGRRWLAEEVRSWLLRRSGAPQLSLVSTDARIVRERAVSQLHKARRAS